MYYDQCNDFYLRDVSRNDCELYSNQQKIKHSITTVKCLGPMK